jgi:hypothetical protein
VSQDKGITSERWRKSPRKAAATDPLARCNSHGHSLSQHSQPQPQPTFAPQRPQRSNATAGMARPASGAWATRSAQDGAQSAPAAGPRRSLSQGSDGGNRVSGSILATPPEMAAAAPTLSTETQPPRSTRRRPRR